jgi:hypothetical protein
MWEYISESKKKKLRGKVDGILASFAKQRLKGYLQKVRGRSSWHVVKSLQAFTRGAGEILDDFQTQQRLEITRD